MCRVQERGTVASLRDPIPAARGSRRRLPLVLVTAAAVVGVDQLTKTLAEHYLRSGPVHLVGTVELSLSYNPGFAFSLGRGLGPELVIVALALIAVLLVVGRTAPTTGTAVAVGLIMGGAAGNLVDRLLRSNRGAVIDFIDLRFWPTFNVADSCIVIGAVVLVVLLARRAL